MDTHKFKTIIVITKPDCERVLPLYPRLVKNIGYGQLCFVGPAEVGELIAGSEIAGSASFVNENDVIPFDDVHACVKKRMESILLGRDLPRGITGWSNTTLQIWRVVQRWRRACSHPFRTYPTAA